MDAGLVVTAAEPVGAGRLVPQRLDQAPGGAAVGGAEQPAGDGAGPQHAGLVMAAGLDRPDERGAGRCLSLRRGGISRRGSLFPGGAAVARPVQLDRSEEHTSELQSLMRISYAVFCLKKKNKN